MYVIAYASNARCSNIFDIKFYKIGWQPIILPLDEQQLFRHLCILTTSTPNVAVSSDNIIHCLAD